MSKSPVVFLNESRLLQEDMIQVFVHKMIEGAIEGVITLQGGVCEFKFN